MRRVGRLNAITDVRGLSVGHFTDLDLLSGITVVLADDEAVGGVDVRGGAPGTRETDLLSPTNLIESVNGIALCGNSVFGLNAVGGIVRFLEERGRGHRTESGHVVPIVPAAVLFDLGRGVKAGHLSEKSGYSACESSSSGSIAEGNVGAGTGAIVGGLKGGIGTASEILSEGFTVGALVAINSVGSPVDHETGGFYARHVELDGEFGNLRSDMSVHRAPNPMFKGNATQHTTIGVVATNAKLSKTQVTKVAQMANDGVARAIYPAHTMFDGDAIFALATGELELLEGRSRTPRKEAEILSLLGSVSADACSRAIIHAILAAETVGQYISYRDKYRGAFL